MFLRTAVAGLMVSGVLCAQARADDAAGCVLGGGSFQYQAVLDPLLASGAGLQSARDALGAQYAAFWYSDLDQGWDVGVAPGSLDLNAARAAIVTQLGAHYTPAQVQQLDTMLHVISQPYDEATLLAVQHQVGALMPTDVYQSWAVGLACTLSNGVRVEVTAYTGDAAPTAAQHDALAALLAPFGDKVRFRLLQGAIVPVAGVGQAQPATQSPTPPTPPTPPTSPVTAPVLRVSSYATLASPRRCVHGRTITVKARKLADLKSLAVSSRGHKRTLAPGRSTRVKLAARGATKIAATVKLTSGATATQTYRFTHC